MTPVPSPWPVNFSNYIVRNENDLIILLEELRDRSAALME
jgi:hypothetical protein